MENYHFSISAHDKSNKLIRLNYTYIILFIFNEIPLYQALSFDIKVEKVKSSSNIRNLSFKINNIFGSMFKLHYYYINLYIGNSKEKQGFILDTGSSILTSSCSLCKNCGKHIYEPYKIDSKKNIISCGDPKCKMISLSKCNNLKCSFKVKYAEGSILEGIFINQKIFFNKEEKNNIEIPIGCTLKENNYFYNQEVNGIIGLNNNENNFIDILYKSKKIKNNIFGICFAHLGGIFTIGEINNKIHKTNITYVPMSLEKNKYYKININSIFVGNKKIDSYKKDEDNNFILDSGATISYFNNKIFEEILNKTLENCEYFNNKRICGTYKLNSLYGHCFYFNNIFELNEAIKKYWPIISFNIGNYNYKWYPENYYYNITFNNEIGACMGFNIRKNKNNILGENWFINHDIIFDKKNRLIGIAEADCYQNKNINKINGLELIDIKSIYSENKNIKNVSFAIIIINIIIICGIIIFCILLYFKNKKHKKVFINKKLIIRYDILVNNIDIVQNNVSYHK